MTPSPETETKEAQRRLAEDRRAKDFGKFLDSLWGKPTGVRA